MPRIRTLKPEFWTDEKLSLLDPLTRLVFLGLISLADDYGRLVDNVKLLDGQIFPHTDDSVLEPLETLSRLSRILRYRSKAGQQCIQIIGWGNHQKVNHPGKEVLPAPTKEDYAQPVTGQPPIPPPQKVSRRSLEDGKRASSESPAPYQRPTTNDQRPSAAQERWGFMGVLRPIWKDLYKGEMDKGSAKELEPLVKEWGLEKVAANLTNYLKANPAPYGTISKFRSTFGTWDTAKTNGVLHLSKEERDRQHFKKMGYDVA